MRRVRLSWSLALATALVLTSIPGASGRHASDPRAASTVFVQILAGSDDCGPGTGCYFGDGGPAIHSGLAGPADVIADADGNLFIADTQNCRIRRIDGATGIIETIAGISCFAEHPPKNGDGGPASEAFLTWVMALTLDAEGNLYLADIVDHTVRRIDAATGIITRVAGVQGKSGFSGDGGPGKKAKLNRPAALAMLPDGRLLISDPGNYRIRVLDPSTGGITTFAGTGADPSAAPPRGDGGPASQASIGPFDIAVDTAGNTFIADAGWNRVRRIDKQTGVITTIAGTGGFPSGPGLVNNGDGGPALAATFNLPTQIAVDAGGNVFVEHNNRVRRIDAATGIIDTYRLLTIQGALASLSVDIDGSSLLFAYPLNYIGRISPRPPGPEACERPLLGTIVGTAGPDRLRGTQGIDIIFGLGGNDRIRGLAGDDLLCGGSGDDLLRGGSGADTLAGQFGDDRLYGDTGPDVLTGGSGNDILRPGAGADMVAGGPGKGDAADYADASGPITADIGRGTASGDGADTLRTVEILNGSPFDDTLLGASGDERLRGRQGDDTLRGRAGDDDLRGGRGDDSLFGGRGTDSGTGGAGVDLCKSIEVPRRCDV